MIVFVALYIAHGFNFRTSAALVGTLATLIFTGLAAAIAVWMTHVSGLSSDEVSFVQTIVGTIDVRGLLLAGIVIGSLGVLNDVTVTQASAVWELHHNNASASLHDLYRSGMRIGRDHIASTVYTLIYAYAGASLPLLILFTLANRQWSDVLTSDVVAEEIVRTLVGTMALVASVPITTMLAALLVHARPQVANRVTGPETVKADKATRSRERLLTKSGGYPDVGS